MSVSPCGRCRDHDRDRDQVREGYTDQRSQPNALKLCRRSGDILFEWLLLRIDPLLLGLLRGLPDEVQSQSTNWERRSIPS
jgi:hypothetical protein